MKATYENTPTVPLYQIMAGSFFLDEDGDLSLMLDDRYVACFCTMTGAGDDSTREMATPFIRYSDYSAKNYNMRVTRVTGPVTLYPL
jgi:hypothetical protein